MINSSFPGIIPVKEVLLDVFKLEQAYLRKVDSAKREYLAAVKAEMAKMMLSAFKQWGRSKGNGHTKPIEAKPRKKAASAQRMLHGKYLGLTRTLPKEQKAKLSTLYKEKGVRAALAEAKRMRASA